VPPRPGGAGWYELVRTGDTAQLGFATSLTDAAAPVFAAREGEVIDWFEPSPDGRYVAMGLSNGDEHSLLRVLDRHSGELLPEPVLQAWHGSVLWDEDSQGFLCAACPDPRRLIKDVWHVPLCDGRPSELVLADAGVDAISLSWSADGARVVVSEGEISPRIVAYGSGSGWQRVVHADPDEVLQGTFHGADLYAFTNRDSSCGRIVRVPGADLDVVWEDLPLPDGLVVQEVQAVPDGLLVLGLVDAQARLLLLRLPSGSLVDLGLPAGGFARLGRSSGRTAQVAVAFSTLTSSTAVLHVDTGVGRLTVARPPEVVLDATVTRCSARSADGTEVPYFLVRPAGASGPLPAVLHGYGGFNLPMSPAYRPEIAALLARGAAYVCANVRGGGEFGRDWWDAARFEHRRRSFEDTAAVLSHLVESGVGVPGRLALYGTSNGGMLAAAVATLYPQLLRAAVSLVPVTDLLGGDDEPYFAHVRNGEFGDPADPEVASWIATYSPLHVVPARAAFPATLICSAADDSRCRPRHGRVLAAAMQQANTGSHPVLLQVWDDGGHLMAATRDAELEHVADWLGFLLHELELCA
jgi:prolyl oligopeptidase